VAAVMTTVTATTGKETRGEERLMISYFISLTKRKIKENTQQFQASH
jgi:hypothetical protein